VAGGADPAADGELDEHVVVRPVDVPKRMVPDPHGRLLSRVIVRGLARAAVRTCCAHRPNESALASSAAAERTNDKPRSQGRQREQDQRQDDGDQHSRSPHEGRYWKWGRLLEAPEPPGLEITRPGGSSQASGCTRLATPPAIVFSTRRAAI
jgi:hypothetical protein